MRSFFFILLLIGAGIAFVYPWAIRSVEGREIGRFALYDAAAGFRSADARLTADDSPVHALVDMTAVVPSVLPDSQSVLTLTVSSAGRTVLASVLGLAGAEVRDDSPQTSQRIYRLDAGPIDVAADGTFTITAAPGEAEGIDLQAVEIVLRAGIGAYDERALPVGLSIMAVGFIGLVIAMRRRSAKTTVAAGEPPKPRWGRGAGER